MPDLKKILLFLFLLPIIGWSQNFPDKPLNYITDEAEVLSAEEEKLLNHKLHTFQDSTSTQVFVYVAPSLNGQDLSTIGQEIFVKWDIGQKGKNNGVLIAVFVKDHKFRIHTGYGMEGVLPDLLTKKIQDEEMRPEFKKDNYYAGIDKGIDKIIYYSKHEYSATTEPNSEDTVLGLIIFYVFAMILYFLNFLLIRYVLKEKKGGKTAMYIVTGVFALIPFFGLFILGFMLLVMGIIALIKLASKASGGGSYTSSNNDNSWYSSSSSSSDSSYSSSSSSDSDSFSGGGGGDSGGGGSNSDW